MLSTEKVYCRRQLRSTTEAELYALVEAVRMALHIRSLLHAIQYGRIEFWDDEVHSSSKPVRLFVDNKSTIAAAIADETTVAQAC